MTDSLKYFWHIIILQPSRIILSVYSPFSDRVGHPLHNIISPFLSVSSLSISTSASKGIVSFT